MSEECVADILVIDDLHRCCVSAQARLEAFQLREVFLIPTARGLIPNSNPHHVLRTQTFLRVERLLGSNALQELIHHESAGA